MQKHVRIVLSILQNFLAISVDRILSALKTTQLFETEIVWKYVLNARFPNEFNLTFHPPTVQIYFGR